MCMQTLSLTTYLLLELDPTYQLVVGSWLNCLWESIRQIEMVIMCYVASVCLTSAIYTVTKLCLTPTAFVEIIIIRCYHYDNTLCVLQKTGRKRKHTQVLNRWGYKRCHWRITCCFAWPGWGDRMWGRGHRVCGKWLEGKMW